MCWSNTDQRRDHGRLWPPDDEAFTSIVAGRNHTCGLRTNGSAICWGENLHSDAFPRDNRQFSQISAGEGTTCGIGSDGLLHCYGYVPKVSGSEIVPPPGGATRFRDVKLGDRHICGLNEDGTAICWGWNKYRQARPPLGEKFTEISASRTHTCGLRADGTAVCWGADGFGIDFGQASPPQQERFTAISCGYYHTCALRTDGTTVCWGAESGDDIPTTGGGRQIGFGQTSPPEGERFTAIASGIYHTCGLRGDGMVTCWGKGYP